MSNAKILDATFRDGLENLIAQLGTSQDKRSYSRFTNSKQLSLNGNQQELNAMYRTDWLCGKVVDIIPDDMSREWRRFTGDLDPKTIKMIEKEEDRLGLSIAFNSAHKWGRLYGGGLIILSVDDGQEPDKPLDISKVKKGGLRYINVIDRHRVSNADITPIVDPMDVNFGKPEFYRINETSIKIHHSRVLRFDGVTLPYDQMRRNNYWSDSVLSRIYDSVTNFNIATNASASMIYESNIDTFKIKGLMNYLQTSDGESKLLKRLTLSGLTKSINNALIIDAEEEYDSKSKSFAGLPELIDRFSLFLSAATDIPATRLLGSSASGFNATGAGDLKNYYDTVRSAQKKVYKPILDYFDSILAKSLGLPEDADLSYEFNSLFQESAVEKADRELKEAQKHQIYLSSGVVTEEIVAKELVQNNSYTNIDEEHLEALGSYEDGEFGSDSDEAEFETEQETQEGREEANTADNESEIS